MTQFKVDTVQMRQIADEVQHIHWEMERIEARLDGMRLNHLLQFRGGARLATQISDCRIACGNQSSNLRNLYRGLESVTELYRDCEEGLTEPKDAETAKREEAKDWWKDLGKDALGIFGKLNGPFGIATGVAGLLTGDYLGGAKSITSGIGTILGGIAKVQSGKSTTCMWGELLGFGLTEKKTFAENLSSGIKKFFPGKNATGLDTGVAVAKWAGVALSFISSGISNYDEFEGDMSSGRYWAETITEGALDVGKGILIGAAVAAVCGGAPAIVVAGGAALVSWGIDAISEAICGKKVTELVSDAILDAGERVVDGIAAGAEAVGDAIADGARAISNGAKALWGGICNAFA